jgi:hypothetical protein
MDQRELPFPKKRLYVAEWSSRALHGTAMMMNRLRMEQDLSERQEWLYDRIIDELEWRFVEDIRLRPWSACSCSLCFAPFPSYELGYESDDGSDDLPQSRPDGEPISRHRRQRPAEE